MLGLCWLALAAGPAAAQGITLSGPVSGLLYNRAARAVQAIAGVPGGACLGAAVISEVDWAAVSPDGKRALAGRGGETFLVKPGMADWTRLEGVPRPELAAWREGAAEVLVYAGGRLAAIGEGGIAELAGPEERVTAVAWGEYAAAATARGVYRVAAEGPARLLAPLNGAAGLAFCGEALFAADREQVLEIRGAEAAGFPAEREGDFTGMACVEGRLVVTGRRQAWVYDLRRRGPGARVELEFEPERAERIGGGRLILLKEDPVRVLAVEPAPGVYFVPAGEE